MAFPALSSCDWPQPVLQLVPHTLRPCPCDPTGPSLSHAEAHCHLAPGLCRAPGFLPGLCVQRLVCALEGPVSWRALRHGDGLCWPCPPARPARGPLPGRRGSRSRDLGFTPWVAKSVTSSTPAFGKPASTPTPLPRVPGSGFSGAWAAHTHPRLLVALLGGVWSGQRSLV